VSASAGGNETNKALQKREAQKQWARWKRRIFWTLSVFLTIFILSCALWDGVHAQRIFAVRAVPVAIFALYGLTWLFFGRDARCGEIRLRSTPPEKMPPGFMACVRNRKIPMGAVVNDLFWLATKGWICFCHSQPEGAHLRRTARADKPQSLFFRALLERLFPQGRDILYLRKFTMDKAKAIQRGLYPKEEDDSDNDDCDDEYPVVYIGSEDLVRLCEAYHWWEQRHQEVCKSLWSYNTRVSFIAFALVFVVCEAIVWQTEESFMMQLSTVTMLFALLLMFLIGCIMLVAGFVEMMYHKSFFLGPFGTLVGILSTGGAAVIFWGEGKNSMIEMFDPGIFVLLLLLLSTAIFFSWRILPRLFAAGARLQGEIEGYARHLAALATGTGKMKPQEFREALPYVFSLGEAYATRFCAAPPEDLSRLMTRHPDIQGDDALWLWKSFCLYRDEIIEAINSGASRQRVASPPL
jgi:hypothetical protein